MPTENQKKKSVKEKKPIIPIKSEPNDIFPLSHYVDDKVELIRQIFGCLKSKTVQSITPDFLQSKNLEELQEICLEEVLGISKKRLLSIINATKCPTDTESSDSESDVEKIEEHISLEEISSDSADEVLNKTQKKAKKKSKVMGSVTKAADSNTNNGTGKKEYSVLELLELQARARAIRSQLALEPVTKIELDDSDADNGDESLTIVPTPTADCASGATAQTGVTTIANEAEATAKPRPGIEELTESSPSVSAVRPIRLKRNFRKRPTDEDEQKVGTEPSDNQKADSAEPTASDAVNSNTNNDAMPDSSKQRSPSPDIIPIIKEPEILCISSGDESETDTDRNSYIKLPTVMKENRPQTEDELFLRKVKENALCRSGVNASADNVSSQANSNGSGEKTTDAIAKDSEMPALTPESKTDDQSAATVQLEQPEDGEILDDDDDDDVDDQPKESTKIVDLDESSNSSSESDSSRSSRSSGSSHSSSSSQSNNGIKGREAEKLETKIEAVVSTSDEVDSKHENTEQSITVADEEEDNDIIDLGKDEDLDFELINTSESTPKKRKTSKDADVPQVPTNRDGDSWGTRWLRGRKVSTVLATSKLASKVRSKIKEKKAKSSEPKKEDAVQIEPPVEVELPENVEVGSVEHYNELTKNSN